MNEIEKLYKNAGIKPYIYCSKPRLNCDAREKGKCKQDCEYYSGIKLLILFTAEKQLAILQLLTQQCDLTISHFTEWEFIHFDGQEPLEVTGKDFTETFAKLINAYWQALAEKEKKQIRRILNG